MVARMADLKKCFYAPTYPSKLALLKIFLAILEKIFFFLESQQQTVLHSL